MSVRRLAAVAVVFALLFFLAVTVMLGLTTGDNLHPTDHLFLALQMTASARWADVFSSRAQAHASQR